MSSMSSLEALQRDMQLNIQTMASLPDLIKGHSPEHMLVPSSTTVYDNIS